MAGEPSRGMNDRFEAPGASTTNVRPSTRAFTGESGLRAAGTRRRAAWNFPASADGFGFESGDTTGSVSETVAFSGRQTSAHTSQLHAALMVTFPGFASLGTSTGIMSRTRPS